MDNFPFYLSLIIAIVLLVMLAGKIRVAYPVLLVIAGLAISFVPGIPVLKMDPELIFFIFLPPLLYEASWSISWKELWKWRRIIGSFAFVIVFLTALAVAFAVNTFIPGFTFAMGLLLGAIVSPPDAVSVGAILKFVKIPKTMASILEGESLLNDASSLIIFRFALLAITTGQFIWYEAALSFGWMVIGGIGTGLLIGWIFMKAHNRLPTDANIDIVLTIVTPYIMYITAEHLHSSGVLAVVSGGLLLSYNRNRFLNSSSRLRGVNVWESLCFVLNGLVFILIGLDLPEITAGLDTVSLLSAIGYAVLVTAVLIISRILSAYGAVLFTLVARNFITVADRRNPGYKGPFVIGWAGMRGVVSLAAALSVPLQLDDGSAFPQRNLILFITFVVILLTLLVQGLTLPLLIRKINLQDRDETMSDEETDLMLQNELAAYALAYLNEHYSAHIGRHTGIKQLALRWERQTVGTDDAEVTETFRMVYTDLLNRQREWLLKRNSEDEKLKEEIVRKHLLRLDLEEEKMRYMR